MELRRRPAILLGDQSAGITLRLINFTSSLLPSGCVCASERLQRGQTERRVYLPTSLGHLESGHSPHSSTWLSYGDSLWHLSPFSCPLELGLMLVLVTFTNLFLGFPHCWD